MQQNGKTTTIRRSAVREAGVSRHHGGPIEGPTETHQISQHYKIVGLRKLRNPDLTGIFFAESPRIFHKKFQLLLIKLFIYLFSSSKTYGKL